MLCGFTMAQLTAGRIDVRAARTPQMSDRTVSTKLGEKRIRPLL